MQGVSEKRITGSKSRVVSAPENRPGAPGPGRDSGAVIGKVLVIPFGSLENALEVSRELRRGFVAKAASFGYNVITSEDEEGAIKREGYIYYRCSLVVEEVMGDEVSVL